MNYYHETHKIAVLVAWLSKIFTLCSVSMTHFVHGLRKEKKNCIPFTCMNFEWSA